jgi:hypothetical protein
MTRFLVRPHVLKYSPTGAVAVCQETVVDTNVLESLDDREGRARQDRLDGPGGGLVRGRGLGVRRLGEVRGGRGAERDGGDEADAGGSQ